MSTPKRRLPDWADLTGASLPQLAASEGYTSYPSDPAEHIPGHPDAAYDEPPQQPALPAPTANGNHAHPTEVAPSPPTWEELRRREHELTMHAFQVTARLFEVDDGANPGFVEAARKSENPTWRTILSVREQPAIEPRTTTAPLEITATPRQFLPEQALGRSMIEGTTEPGPDAALEELTDELEQVAPRPNPYDYPTAGNPAVDPDWPGQLPPA